MNVLKQTECVKQFLDEAADSYSQNPDQVLLEVRRYAAERDSVELASEGRFIIQCRLGGCAVSLSRPNGFLEVTSPECTRK